MPYFVLFYDVVDDFPAKRAPFRAEHLRQVQNAHDSGELLMAGALSEPCDRAVLCFALPSAPPLRLLREAIPT